MLLDPFLALIAPLVPACPDSMIEQYLVMAARELCQRTRVWRVTDVLQTTGAEVELSFVPPEASLIQIEKVEFDGLELCPRQFRDLWRHDMEAGGVPHAYTQPRPETLLLIPSAAGTVRVSLFVMPGPTASTLPDFMFGQYAAELADGALAALLLLPGQSWTNPQLGLVHRSRFDAALDRTFAVHMRGQHRAPVRTKPRYF